MTIAVSSPVLQAKVAKLETENEELRWKVRDLQQQLWGRKSERTVTAVESEQAFLFAEPAPIPAVAVPPTAKAPRTAGAARGPRPLDPDLPREIVRLPDPDLKELMCPVMGRPMRPGFVETLEVLARKPAVWFVKSFERTVFVSEAKSAPVYSPWPSDVLSRSRVHGSVVAYIAAQHFCEHQPYFRLEKHLERIGVNLPRSTQVSLMEQLDERVQPLVEALKQEVLKSGYVHLDATPIDLCDPARPGATREATLWAYRAQHGPVWFDYQQSKSPSHPHQLLVAAKFEGKLQTDGASGLDKLGVAGQVVHLGCFAHLRRYFFKAVQANDLGAQPYLDTINRLFRADRLARHFKLSVESRRRLRTRYSHPRFLTLVTQARQDALKTPPKTGFGAALHYLLSQLPSLERCLTTLGARLDNNPAENAIRPLKLGAKNWLQIGHPSAGPRLARLFALIENCRQEGIDPEAYLIDLISRLLDHPMKHIADLLPRQWKAAKSQPAA